VLEIANFVEVLPVGGSVKVNDTLMLVNGLEIYQGAFSLSLNIRFAPDMNIDHRQFPRPTELKLTDDTGTLYNLMNRGSSGGFMGDWQHNYVVQPLIDPAATTLTLEVPKLSFDSGMGRGGQPEATSLSGPWLITLKLPSKIEKSGDS